MFRQALHNRLTLYTNQALTVYFGQLSKIKAEGVSAEEEGEEEEEL